MTVYIYSKISDYEWRVLSVENCISKMFIAVGIFLEYKENNTSSTTSFNDFYNEQFVNEEIQRPFHFRNIAERYVRKELGKNINIYYCRHDMRIIYKTYNGFPVTACDNFPEIYEIIKNTIRNEPELNTVIGDKLSQMPEQIWGFQHSFLTIYTTISGKCSRKKQIVFREVLNRINRLNNE